MVTSIVSNNTAATFGNSPQKTGEPVDRLSIYSGKALEFDGVSDFIEPKQGSTYWQPSTHDKMTFAVWIKTTGGGDIFEGGGRNYNAFRIYGQSNVLKVELNSTGIHSDTTVIDDGVWHRIVVSFDKDASSNQVNIYVDGKLSTSHTNTSAISGLNNSNSVNYPMIGANSSALLDNVWGGLMADFQYWTEAWDLEDVTYDYLHPEKLITSNSSATSNITSSSLELWYPMNDTGITNPQTVIFDGANSGGLESTITPHLNDDGNFNGNNWSITAGDTGDWTGHTSSQTSMTLTKNGTDTGDLRLNLQSSINSGMSSDLQAGAYYKFTHTVSTTSSLPSWQFRINHGSGTTTRLYEGTNNVIYFTAEAASVYIQVRSNTDGQNFTLSNISLEKVKQPFHATTTFFGDDKLGGNGGFDATSNWSVVSGSVGTEWTINDSSNSKAVHNTSNANTLRYTGSSGDLVSGTTYQVDFTIADRTAGSLTFALGGAAASSSQTASGSIELTAGGTSNRIIDINPTSDFDGSIDSVTVKEVGIATGWTEAEQQQYIPQTAFMDGCVKNIFDGTDDVVTTTATVSNLSLGTGSVSASAWVIWTEDKGAYAKIIGFDNVTNKGFGIISDSINNKIRAYSGDGSATKYADLDSPTHNIWYHLVATYDSSDKKTRLYVNGSLQDTSAANSGDISYYTSGSSEYLTLGEMSYHGYHFYGFIDEANMWNKALSASEVVDLYNDGVPLNATKSTASSNLIGYWKNNKLESTGKWEDLSTNDNHGTVTSLDNSIFFQQGVTANLCTQGYSNNIVQPSKGATYSNGVSDYMDLGKDIEIEGDFMVMFWFKGNPSDVPYLFGAGNLDYLTISDEDTLLLKMNNTNETIDLESGTDIGIEQWHHIAITRTGASGTIKIYFNNVAQTTDTEESTETLKIRTLMRKGLGSDNYGKGMIDDFFVYDNFNENTINKNYKHGKSQHKNS